MKEPIIMETNEINEIIGKMKTEIREGLAEKKMDLTAVSMAMAAALGDVRAAVIQEVEKIAKEEQHPGASDCPYCGGALKKTAKSRKKKMS
jgi:hypothetical protein